MPIQSLVLSFLTAFALGVPAGFSPGPLIALTIKETARGGHRAGLRVAFIPALLGNLPLGIICTLFFMQLHRWATAPSTQSLLVAITAGLSCLVLWRLAYKELKRQPLAEETGQAVPASSPCPSFWDLLLVGAINPNMMIFWGTVGGQLASKAYMTGLAALIVFMMGFYVPIIASELLTVYSVAFVSRTRNHLPALRWHWVPVDWRYSVLQMGDVLVRIAYNVRLRLEKSPAWQWLQAHFHLDAPKPILGASVYFGMGVWILAYSYA